MQLWHVMGNMLPLRSVLSVGVIGGLIVVGLAMVSVWESALSELRAGNYEVLFPVIVLFLILIVGLRSFLGSSSGQLMMSDILGNQSPT